MGLFTKKTYDAGVLSEDERGVLILALRHFNFSRLAYGGSLVENREVTAASTNLLHNSMKKRDVRVAIECAGRFVEVLKKDMDDSNPKWMFQKNMEREMVKTLPLIQKKLEAMLK